MAFPQTLDPAAPAGSDSPSLGDDQIRALKQTLADLFGVPVSPSTVAAAGTKMGTDGQLPLCVRLTNKTGGSVAANDVVQVDTAADEAVVLGNTIKNVGQLVVAAETVANNAEGLFYKAGVVTVATTGTVNRGEYLWKSTTTKVCESTSIVLGTASAPPTGSFAVALTAASGGTCTAYLFGYTVAAGWVLHAVSAAEATTTSTSTADVKSITTNIPAALGFRVMCNIRKTAGAAASAQVGLKLNATQVSPNQAWSSATNQAESGWFYFDVPPRTTNHLRGGYGVATSGTADMATGRTMGSADMPTVAITAVVITGLVGDAAVTLGVKDAVVYVMGWQ